MSTALLTAELRFERDVVLARQRARQVAALLGFEPHEQVRIATATSEIARNAYEYAGGGRVEFLLVEGAPQALEIRVTDRGRGVADLNAVLDGHYRSPTGLGLGIIGARRLMDRFEIDSTPGNGTRVVMGQNLPRRAPMITQAAVAKIAAELAAGGARNPFEEVQQQNQELLRTLNELRERQSEVERLNRELEETNRGVVALYAELDEKASELQRASELKSRFLSYMSHEFRTPLNSINSLSRLLLERADGELEPEQEKQVYYIRKSSDTLTSLVNDLLDLAKIEAGKVDIHSTRWEVAEVLSTLRGVFRPLVSSDAVALVIEPPAGIPAMHTDEGKVAQILRNFISNALKFTPQGEVRVAASTLADGTVCFSVQDTGIGIAPADQERIFEEFSQVDGPIQKHVKGTGLGLPLSRKLAELLGGTVSVTSTPGVGSTFALVIPAVHPSAADTTEGSPQPPAKTYGMDDRPSTPQTILIIDDDEVSRYLLKGILAETQCILIEADNGRDGLRLARETVPDAIFLDLVMPEMTGFEVLEALRSDYVTEDIPVVISSSSILSDEERERLNRHATAILTKDTRRSDESTALVLDALVKCGLKARARTTAPL